MALGDGIDAARALVASESSQAMQPIYLSIDGLFGELAKSRASPEEWRRAVGRLTIAFGLIEL